MAGKINVSFAGAENPKRITKSDPEAVRHAAPDTICSKSGELNLEENEGREKED